MTAFARRCHLLFVCLLLNSGCGLSADAGDDDASDGDADADSDADADTDADADADGDGDGDGDADAGEQSAIECTDDADNDGNGLLDCLDPGCAGLVACCGEDRMTLLEDSFDGALDLATWKSFGDGEVQLRDASLYPAGDDRFENGVVTNEAHSLGGVVELRFVSSVPDCDGPCGELLGVALTGRNDYADSSSVDPAAGLVIEKSDGQAQLLLVVNGAVEARSPIAEGTASITLAIQPDRRIHVTTDLGVLVFDSKGALDPALAEVYVAIFGRGGSSAGVSDVSLQTGACALPSAVVEGGPVPDLRAGIAGFATSAARAASVSAIPGSADLELLFTGVSAGATAIGHATSSDGGHTWSLSPGETAVMVGTDMPLGWTGPDEPALLVRYGGDRMAVVSAESIGDASQRSLVFATSADGLAWNVLPDPPLAPPEGAGCRSLRSPALVEPVPGSYVLFATCETDDGVTSILRATAPDLSRWTFDPGPTLDRDDGRDALELDGVAAPTVLVGTIWEMWYEARAGGQRALKYAASIDGVQWTRWDGAVLAPGAAGAWDELRVGEPSAVPISGGAELRLFYTGLGASGQAIGVVTRVLPAH